MLISIINVPLNITYKTHIPYITLGCLNHWISPNTAQHILYILYHCLSTPLPIDIWISNLTKKYNTFIETFEYILRHHIQCVFKHLCLIKTHDFHQYKTAKE